MVHVGQLWYMCYSYVTCVTGMVHVLYLWYMCFSKTYLVHVLQQ